MESRSRRARGRGFSAARSHETTSVAPTRESLLDVLTFPESGGSRRLLAFILEPSAIERILSYLGLSTEPPKVHPARASPEQEEFAFAE